MTTCYTAPDTNADALPTFLGNHDMGRIGTFLASGGTDPADASCAGTSSPTS